MRSSASDLRWLTAAFGMWAFGRKAGLYAGLVMATCVGLFLFTRILIPDVMLTFTITLAHVGDFCARSTKKSRIRDSWAFVDGGEPRHWDCC